MKKKVLIINDSKFEQKILKDLFEKINFDAHISNEFDAIENCISVGPDLVMANYIMEKRTGIEMIREIKFIYPNLRCILSSCDDVSKETRQYDYIDSFIQTPINTTELVSKIIALWQ